jgi:aerobic-type carbon monoxide dehydrogenase small subunit (CoxS/CutS family)
MAVFTLRINGRTHRVEGEATDTLLPVLRYELGLAGSKFGCGEGHCGACTVLLDGQPLRSCVTRLGAAAEAEVTTIEGVADGPDLHPVQQAFIDAEAFQCGYCTPGMVMATIGMLRTTPDPGDEDIARLLDRNVCRCGVYPRLVVAVKDAAERLRTRSSGGER